MNPLSILKKISVKYWILIILIILVLIYIIVRFTMSSAIRSETFNSKKMMENYSDMSEISDISQLKPAKDEVIFAKFYAPWCGYCTKLKPTWDELNVKFNHQVINNKKIKIVKVNCDDYPKIAEHYDVSGYPTIKLISSDGVNEYNDNRSLEAMQSFLVKKCNAV